MCTYFIALSFFSISELFNAPAGRYKADVYLMPKLMDEFVARYFYINYVLQLFVYLHTLNIWFFYIF